MAGRPVEKTNKIPFPLVVKNVVNVICVQAPREQKVFTVLPVFRHVPLSFVFWPFRRGKSRLVAPRSCCTMASRHGKPFRHVVRYVPSVPSRPQQPTRLGLTYVLLQYRITTRESRCRCFLPLHLIIAYSTSITTQPSLHPPKDCAVCTTVSTIVLFPKSNCCPHDVRVVP